MVVVPCFSLSSTLTFPLLLKKQHLPCWKNFEYVWVAIYISIYICKEDGFKKYIYRKTP